MSDLQRDYVLLIDKSGSMATTDCNGKSRWEAMQESTLAFASKAATLDPDGIDVVFFNNAFYGLMTGRSVIGVLLSK